MTQVSDGTVVSWEAQLQKGPIRSTVRLLAEFIFLLLYFPVSHLTSSSPWLPVAFRSQRPSAYLRYYLLFLAPWAFSICLLASLSQDNLSLRFAKIMWSWEWLHFARWSESESHSVVSDSLQPHGLYSSWNSPGHNTGVGSLSLLQGIFPTQGLNSGFPHCRQILYQLSH